MTIKSYDAVGHYLECDSCGCVNCSSTVYGDFFSDYEEKWAKIKWFGWVWEGGKHFCPECAKKYRIDPCIICGFADKLSVRQLHEYWFVECKRCSITGTLTTHGTCRAIELWNNYGNE